MTTPMTNRAVLVLDLGYDEEITEADAQFFLSSVAAVLEAEVNRLMAMFSAIGIGVPTSMRGESISSLKPDAPDFGEIVGPYLLEETHDYGDRLFDTMEMLALSALQADQAAQELATAPAPA